MNRFIVNVNGSPDRWAFPDLEAACRFITGTVGNIAAVAGGVSITVEDPSRPVNRAQREAGWVDAWGHPTTAPVERDGVSWRFCPTCHEQGMPAIIPAVVPGA